MRTQRGNALFLILIAVALFAALSYAITQSGRGGGTITKEQAALEAAQIIQVAGDLQNTAQRMILNGTAKGDVLFGTIAQSNTCGSDNESVDLCTTGDTCLFAPEGGGATIPQLPEDAFTPIDGGSWCGTSFFEGAHSFNGINITFDHFTGLGTNDIDVVAEFMPLKQEVCSAINKGLGFGSDIPIAWDDYAPWDTDGTAGPYTQGVCLDMGGGYYYYFSPIITDAYPPP